MKKSYLQPEVEVLNVNVVEMLAGSITNVEGPIDLADPTDPVPGEADVKSSIFEEDFWQ